MSYDNINRYFWWIMISELIVFGLSSVLYPLYGWNRHWAIPQVSQSIGPKVCRPKATCDFWDFICELWRRTPITCMKKRGFSVFQLRNHKYQGPKCYLWALGPFLVARNSHCLSRKDDRDREKDGDERSVRREIKKREFASPSND